MLIKHKCLLGDNCEKYKVALQSVAFSAFKEGGRTVTSSMHCMSGAPENIDKFLRTLNADKNIITLERRGDMFFLLEKADLKAVEFHTPKIIFVKPVLTDANGRETWEIGTWERAEMVNFISNVKRKIKDFKLLKFHNIAIDNVFFPKLMPDLTEKQKRAIDLAIAKGYYKTPRKTDLRRLAKLSGISLSTYEQHLRAAEEKLIPNLLEGAK